MKQLFATGLLFAVNHALAHPGHGRPGWLHFHEYSDGLMILLGLVAVGLLCRAWKNDPKKPRARRSAPGELPAHPSGEEAQNAKN